MDDVNVDKMVADRQNELDRELRLCLKQINSQIEEIRQEAVRTQTAPVTMRDSKGDYIWAPLVVAKAHVLRSLFLITEKDEEGHHGHVAYERMTAPRTEKDDGR